MNFKSGIDKIQKQINGKILFGENLSNYSWFNLGGPAKILFKPKNLKDLSLFLKKIDKKIPIKVLGAGSNTLIRDGGYDGIILKLGKTFSHISLLDDQSIIAGSAALDKSVSNFAMESSISGFEFLSCIPGSIGGAIRMNSGCYDNDISKILVSVQAIDFEGNLKVIPSSKIKFFYRGSNLSEDLIFISATFKGFKGGRDEIEKKMKDFYSRKKITQPSNIKTCGSTFKNPAEEVNKKAWQLIKDAECDKMSQGEAEISSKHCNFFVNKGSATAKELEDLIIKVQKKVLEKTGVNLETEIQIIGKT